MSANRTPNRSANNSRRNNRSARNNSINRPNYVPIDVHFKQRLLYFIEHLESKYTYNPLLIQKGLEDFFELSSYNSIHGSLTSHRMCSSIDSYTRGFRTSGSNAYFIIAVYIDGFCELLLSRNRLPDTDTLLRENSVSLHETIDSLKDMIRSTPYLNELTLERFLSCIPKSTSEFNTILSKSFATDLFNDYKELKQITGKHALQSRHNRMTRVVFKGKQHTGKHLLHPTQRGPNEQSEILKRMLAYFK